MRRWSAFLVLVVLVAPMMSHAAGDAAVAARFINALGLDLLSKSTKPGDNALLSPYSIELALAMTYAGAAGDTRREMASVLHYPGDAGEPQESLHQLQSVLDKIADDTAKEATARGSGDPITYVVANRLFGEKDYVFRDSFTGFVQQNYGAPIQLVDFRHNAEGARVDINAWVQKQTRDRIRDLIPPGALNDLTRLVLANAIYLKAPWQQPFSDGATSQGLFHLSDGTAVGVPMMHARSDVGYAKRDGYTVVALPYVGEQLQLLLLLPDAANGLQALEQKVTPDLLASSAGVGLARVDLEIPKFKLEPPAMSLGETLVSLGMKGAFDVPTGAANFDGIAPRRPDDYISISNVFHKAFLDVNEQGTEASAATAVVMVEATSVGPKPIEINIDRPFLFAIQHRGSGACLFLGRVIDPR